MSGRFSKSASRPPKRCHLGERAGELSGEGQLEVDAAVARVHLVGGDERLVEPVGQGPPVLVAGDAIAIAAHGVPESGCEERLAGLEVAEDRPSADPSGFGDVLDTDGQPSLRQHHASRTQDPLGDGPGWIVDHGQLRRLLCHLGLLVDRPCAASVPGQDCTAGGHQA
jgi:hypothetical protein